MTSSAVHVRQARIVWRGEPERAGSSTWWRAGLEDALRCASQPAAWAGRLVLVRRLRLHRRAQDPPERWVQAIEAAWRQAADSAVHHSRAQAHDEAVWFDDLPTARLALIEALLGTAARASRSTAVEPLPWPLAQLEAQCLGEREARTLSRAQRLAFALAAPLSDGIVVAGTAAVEAAFIATAFERLVAEAVAAAVIEVLSSGQARRVWQGLVSHAATVAPIAEAAPRDATGPPSHQGSRISRSPTAAHARLQALVEHMRRDPEQQLPRNDGLRATAPRTVEHGAAPIVPPTAEPDGIYTRWAGLLFLPGLLLRAGLAPSEPEEAMAMLAAAVEQMHIASDDPLRAALAPWLDGIEPTRAALTSLRAARRWSLQRLRLPLRRIAARGGRVLATQLRLDIVFPLSSADLRLRRAGIDIDPGWLPWLRCSLHYHYGER